MRGAHSVEVRKLAVAHVKNGASKVSACKVFKVSRTTLYRWLRLNQSRKGNLSLKIRTKFRDKKVSDDVLEAFVKQHPDAILDEIAQEFNMKISSVFRRLEKLGITLKKKISYTRKEITLGATFLRRLSLL